MKIKALNDEHFKTKVTVFLLNFTNEPLAASYALLTFILRKELHITPFQLSFFVMIKPLILSLSFFWGLSLRYKENPNLLKNSILAWILARIPFLFFPFINNFYFVLLASSFYLIFHKAGMPALNEIIKRNIKDEEKIINLFFKIPIFIFIESIILGIFIEKFLNKNSANWKMLFFIFSLFSLLGLFLKMKIKVPKMEFEKNYIKQNFSSSIKDIFILLRARKDFAYFQLGFMIGGGSLMLISPALYIYLTDNLNLTNSNMTIARLIIMSFGFILSSYFWKKFLTRLSMNKLITWVIAGFSIYVFLLLLAQINLLYFYLSFFVYGIAQSGSSLLWNLSGIYFAKSQNSIIFTSTNLFFLGARGIVAPFIGSFLCYLVNPVFTLLIGFLILIFGIVLLYRLNNANIKEVSKINE